MTWDLLQLIEEQDAVVGEADLAGSRIAPAADEASGPAGGAGGGVVVG